MLNRARPRVLAATVCMALANASTSAALPTTYVYTGNTYDFINLIHPDPSPYTTSMRQTWTLDLDDAIPANSVNFVADGHVQSFFVTDGVLSFVPDPNAPNGTNFTNARDPADYPQATFSTDSAGQIVAWNAYIGGEWFMGTAFSPETHAVLYESTGDDLSGPYVTSSSPGKWAILAIPEPATAALFTIGLLVLAGLRRAMSRSVLNV